MTTAKAFTSSPAKKSKSTSDFSASKSPITNPIKSSQGISTPITNGMQTANNSMGAFYSSAPSASFSPAVQAKLIQKKESEAESVEDEQLDSAEESDSVQFMCAGCDGNNDAGEKDTGTRDEDSGAKVVQQQSSDEDVADEEDGDDFVQLECAECNAKSEQEGEEEGDESVQAQDAGGELEDAAEESDEGPADPVQMWSCGKYKKPTCAIQKKDDGGAGEIVEEEEASDQGVADETMVQEKCSTCDKEKPVQEKASEKGRSGSGSRVKDASAGLKNANSVLPHQEAIQSSFGHHDISNIRTEVGGSAGRASRKMGALAYASGDRIGFRSSPGLHLAAHEAAHTVQQRSGLKLPGNVGTPGDKWERHADSVADAVVAGKSAEGLLDSVVSAPSLGSGAAVAPAHSAPSVAEGQGAPANGDGISAAAVQHRITSGASHQVASLERDDAEGAGAGGSESADKGAAGGGAAGGGGDGGESAGEGMATEQQEESDPAADCQNAKGDDGGGDKSKKDASEGGGDAGADGAAKGEEAGQPEVGRCYSTGKSVEAPKGAEDPKGGDAPPNKIEEKTKVTYGDWEESDDTCECAAFKDAQDKGVGVGEGKGESVLSAQVESSGAGGGESDAGGAGSGVEVAEGAGGGKGGASAAGAGPAQEAGAGGDSKTDFASNEASRDAAAAKFDAAVGTVSKVPDRASKLEKGLSFAGAKSGGAAEESIRNRALAQIKGFMSNASAQVNSAVSFVSSEVPARFRGIAESVKAGIGMSMESQKGSISRRIAKAKAKATDQASGARAAINASHDANVAKTTKETDAAIAKLSKAYEKSSAAVSKRETASLTEINSKFSKGRTDHETKGTTAAGSAISIGQNWVDKFDGCRAGPGNNNKSGAADGFWDGCLTVRRAKAQQDAACKSASGTASGMIEMANKKAFELRDKRTQFRCTVIAAAGEAQKSLDTTLDQLVTGMSSGKDRAIAAIGATRDSKNTAVDAALKSNLASLDKQKHEQKQAVNDAGYVQEVGVEEQAHQVATGLVESVNAAMETLEKSLSGLREKLLEGDAPPPDMLNETLASAEEGLGGGVGSLLEKMEEGASGGESSISSAGAKANGALQEITTGNSKMSAESETSFSSQMSTLVSGATDAMTAITDKHVTKAKESAVAGSESMTLVATKFVEATEQVYTEADAAITASLDALGTNLDSSKEALPGKIAAESWRAASKEQPAWKGIVAIVLIILIIIASVAISIFTAGAGGVLGAILIGALLGAVSAGLMQVINNWAAGEDLTKGLLTAVVMGAIGGALGGAIGAGANSLAQVAVQGAVKAGASIATRVAINVSINLVGDLLAEGATQAIGAKFFGQKMTWEGFVTATFMSMATTVRGGAAGSPTGASGGAARGTGMNYATDAAVGLGVGLGLEVANVAMGGEFDAKRLAQNTAGAAGASRASSVGAHKSRMNDAASGSSSAAGDVDAPATTAPKTTVETDAPSPSTKTSVETDAPTTPSKVASEVDAPSRTKTGDIDADASGSPRKPGDTDTDSTTTRKPGDTDADSSTTRKPGDTDTDGTGQKRPAGEDPDAPSQKPKTDVDPNEPINNKTSAEVEEMTKTPVKVGDADHETFVKKPTEKTVECDICSAGCGPVKEKIKDIESEVKKKTKPSDEELDIVEGLNKVSEKVAEAEARIEGNMEAGVFEAGKKVIDLARDIADQFQALGKRHAILGDAINDPFVLSGKGGKVDLGKLDPSLTLKLDTAPDPFALKDFESIKSSMDLAADQQCVYVLRGPGGVILKVGKSSAGNMGKRFGKYKTAGVDLDIELTLEVTPLKNGKGFDETDASGIENAMRSGLMGEGHIMPWDNTGGRLNRPGTGVPFEPIRGKRKKNDEGKWRVSDEITHEWTDKGHVKPVDDYVAPERQQKPSPDVLKALKEKHGGDMAKVREDIKDNYNMDRSLSTIYKWYRDLN